MADGMAFFPLVKVQLLQTIVLFSILVLKLGEFI